MIAVMRWSAPMIRAMEQSDPDQPEEQTHTQLDPSDAEAAALTSPRDLHDSGAVHFRYCSVDVTARAYTRGGLEVVPVEAAKYVRGLAATEASAVLEKNRHSALENQKADAPADMARRRQSTGVTFSPATEGP